MFLKDNNSQGNIKEKLFKHLGTNVGFETELIPEAKPKELRSINPEA